MKWWENTVIKSKQNTELLCKVILATYTNSQFVIRELILVEREGCNSWDKPQKSKIFDAEHWRIFSHTTFLFDYLTPSNSYPELGCRGKSSLTWWSSPISSSASLSRRYASISGSFSWSPQIPRSSPWALRHRPVSRWSCWWRKRTPGESSVLRKLGYVSVLSRSAFSWSQASTDLFQRLKFHIFPKL